ncbi:hypothetical protein BH20ACT9_BH20ACT9_20770 [soil metagenome]
MSTNTDAHRLEQPDRLSGVNYLELTFAVMGGAVAWLSRLILSSALVTYACQIRATWPLWTTTAATGLVAAAALASSLRFWRRKDSGDDTSHIGTAGWLGLLGTFFNVTALVGIVFESVPIAFIDICRAAVP